MNTEIKFLDTKKNIYSDSSAHMVRHIGTWWDMTEREFMRVLQSGYELESMHSDNWASFSDATGEEIERYESKGITHLTLVFQSWYVADDLKKIYMGINNFFLEGRVKYNEMHKNEATKFFTETLVFPIENKGEIIAMAKANNFDLFLKAIVE